MDKKVVAAVAYAVPQIMASRGFEPDCTLGTRLAISTLRGFGIPAGPIATSLVILDSVATRAASEGGELKGAILRVGFGTGRSFAAGWDGHLVARAKTPNGYLLVDTTIAQVARHEEVADVVGEATALVSPLPDDWPKSGDAIEFALNGGTVIYRREPDANWRESRGWNAPGLAELVRDVTSRVQASL